MAYYITKPNIITGETMYYTGNRHWSDRPEKKKTYSTKSGANAQIFNPNGLNGGWKNAQIVSE